MKITTLRPEQNSCHFVEDTFKCIIFDKKVSYFDSNFQWSLFLNKQLAMMWNNDDLQYRAQH